jgi:MFS family permease
MCIGLTLTGLSMSLLIVPLIPEIINSTLSKNPLIQETPSLCAKASALSLTAQSLGYIFGPIIGGSLFDMEGFRGTTDILMISALILALLYYIINMRGIRAE